MGFFVARLERRLQASTPRQGTCFLTGLPFKCPGGAMDAKKFVVIMMVTMVATPCLAGQTTISGTMSCTMPEHVELQTAQPVSGTTTIQPPSAVGTGSSYDVSTQNRPPKTEEMTTEESRITKQNDQGQKQTVTIYTVCAK
ncbi:hypothetical protein BU251_05110 [Candidatus Velamenicoccus archaeovorus]|uniref:Uncharacterized protein n=2 Tax=Velamenicoccus archaeovorus TaxID=1930593 RepID=A0A410P502_VELA1|nr:hypothetical protein BU251_05110 [Candidatus Velamenicoccus archaeovorus]